MCWREKGSRRSLLEHPTPSCFCASRELAMYLSGRLPSVHSDPLRPPASGDVPRSLAPGAVLLGTGRRKPARSRARAAPGTGNALSHRLPSPSCFAHTSASPFASFLPIPPVTLGSLSFFHTRVDSTSASWVPAALTKFSSARPLFPFFPKSHGCSPPPSPRRGAEGTEPELPGVTHAPARLKQAARVSVR